MSQTSAKIEPARPVGPPDAIRHHTRSHCLHLTWPEGLEARLDTRQLRNHCKCSTCRALGLQGWLETGRDIGLERVELFGVAGLQCHFSDGHDRGVFPWQYLYELGDVIGVRE